MNPVYSIMIPLSYSETNPILQDFLLFCSVMTPVYREMVTNI